MSVALDPTSLSLQDNFKTTNSLLHQHHGMESQRYQSGYTSTTNGISLAKNTITERQHKIHSHSDAGKVESTVCTWFSGSAHISTMSGM